MSSLHPADRPPVRVLRLFSRLNIGGPGVHVILLTAGLREHGYDTKLVVGHETPREGNLDDLARARGVTPIRMGGLGREIRPLGDLRAFWGLLRLLRSYRPHVVHTHTAKAGALGRLAAWLSRVPVVIHTYHGHALTGYFGGPKAAIYRAIEAFLSRLTDVLVTVSDAVKNDLVDLEVAGAKKIRVIPLGLDLERLAAPLPRASLRREAGFDATAPLIGIVGRLVPIKDVPAFLRAVRQVLDARPEVRVSVVGDGEDREVLEGLTRDLGLGSAVFFHGWRRDMAEVYGDLDVVVNSSRNEGTPVALIEALAAGRPVVATSVGGTPDLLGGGERGLLVGPGDPQALASGILATLEGGAEVDARRRAGRDYVLTHHGVTRLLRDIDELYRERLALRLGDARS